ncbi:spore germination protein [Desulfuribacillus alkaliarsenatis]|uniref:Uncharacterized protein n=1 Tax=Desulfuribacillus alkaliarsenatis TaxID=766136 RepID=A0A1E5G3Z6_9FIRM|nr:spore germination protein [Desulfuribacillus alkaliarsenatis]OEF97806.1 hypothetical protein BHF68_13285 [Desulfuribacillus alkaliarsenatis]
MQRKKSPFVLHRSVPIKYVKKPIELSHCKRKLEKIFSKSLDLTFREVGDRFLIAYLFSVIDFDRLERTVIAPLKEYLHEDNEEKFEQEPPDRYHRLFTSGVINLEREWIVIARQMIKGSAVVFERNGTKPALIMLPQIERRQVMEPEGEKTVRGPREGFIEDLQVNMGLLRKKLRTPSLVFEEMTIGSISETRVAIVYVKGICDPEIIKEVRDRLSFINIQSVLDTGYLEEFLIDHPSTPLPQAEHTEKPDKLVAEILEGRVGIIVNGAPSVVIVPTIFTQFIQAAEDHYENYWYATALRMIRILGITLALFLPGFWVALTTMHQEMLPTPLVLKLAGAREGVPFPTAVEAFVMELAFELLREAGLRLPSQIGPAVSIVGALIIGQAAVEAGLVSPSLVVVVAVAGVSSFLIPSYRLSIGLRLLRFVVLFVSAVLGLIGLVLLAILMLVHLNSMQSYGTPYFEPLSPIKYSQFRDFALRKDWRSKAKDVYNIGLNRAENKVSPERPAISEMGNYRKE